MSPTPHNVLIVEDEEVTQSILINLLSKIDLTPKLAKNGAEFREALKAQSFDLILMDISLPDSSGIELCKEIREKEKGSSKRTLIVALTGMNKPEDRKTCLDAGMDGYFTKPIDRLKIQSFVKNLLKIGK